MPPKKRPTRDAQDACADILDAEPPLRRSRRESTAAAAAAASRRRRPEKGDTAVSTREDAATRSATTADASPARLPTAVHRGNLRAREKDPPTQQTLGASLSLRPPPETPSSGAGDPDPASLDLGGAPSPSLSAEDDFHHHPEGRAGVRVGGGGAGGESNPYRRALAAARASNARGEGGKKTNEAGARTSETATDFAKTKTMTTAGAREKAKTRGGGGGGEGGEGAGGLFAGVSAFVREDVGRARREVFAARLAERGGFASTAAGDPRTTHVVTADASWTPPPGVKIVAPEWVTECLKTGRRAREEDFPPSRAARAGAFARAPTRGGGETLSRRGRHSEKPDEKPDEENPGSSGGGPGFGRRLQRLRAAEPEDSSTPPRDGAEENLPGDDRALAPGAADEPRVDAGAAARAAASSSRALTLIPDSESQERPFLGRVKARLACQTPSGAADQAFACAANLNARLTDPLEALAELYDAVLGEPHKAKHHARAAAAIKDLPFRVESVAQLERAPGTGRPVAPAFAPGKASSVRSKVAALLATGRLEKLEELTRDKRVVALRDLARVWGVGPDTARRLYARGATSVDALRRLASEDARLLTPPQRVGLAFVDEFAEKMPRAEAARIGAVVRDAAEETCPGCAVHLAGSFRRNKPRCGDVDVLIAPSEAFLRRGSQASGGVGVERFEEILPAVLARLRARGLLTHDLGAGDGSYMGVAKLNARGGGGAGEGGGETPEPASLEPASPSLHRRIDIKVYRPEELPFALLYFTGSGYFNRSMRWWAKKKFGLSLNDKGFGRDPGNPAYERAREGTFRDEKDIFDFLKLAYVEPEDRSV